MGGEIGLAVSPLGFDQKVERAGGLRSAVAWSTSKVPIAMAIYDAGLASQQQQNLRAAITASDNAAAQAMWDALGGGRHAARDADVELRSTGDTRTAIQPSVLRSGFTAFGQTEWSLADQVRFTAGMPCRASGAQVLGLMNEVIPSERWGLGSAGVPAQLKGGWGPGTHPGVASGYLDRQMGVLTIAGKPMAIAIASLPADGSHETGTRNLTSIAQWAVRHVDAGNLPQRPRCAA